MLCLCSFSRSSEKCLNKFINKKPLLIDLKPNKFEEVLEDIKLVGQKLNKEGESNFLIQNIKNEINKIKTKTLNSKIKNVLCVEWIEPIMAKRVIGFLN